MNRVFQGDADVILIGAGIMSATLGTLLKTLEPDWKIIVFEKLDKAAQESSNEWNNAGTGHAALCELNYTPELPDGSVDVSKAIKINEQFQISLQFWSYLVQKGLIQNPREFVMPLPHISFVQGEDNVAFLKKRYEALSRYPQFEGMRFSEDPQELKEWMPLVMEGRSPGERVAATMIEGGTDVNFGALTRKLFELLEQQGVDVLYRHLVQDIKRTAGGWQLTVRNEGGTQEHYSARFVFIGAGGASLPLLQKSGIPEGKQIGGFPVSGLFLVCRNPELIERHQAKVYGKAAIGAPPMSVPHLDTRYIDNKKTLLFGPFAGFSPKFLKTGSNMDLFRSIRGDNLLTLLAAGVKNISLTKYLIQQLMLSWEQRIEELRRFVPTARGEDWDMVVAGQRVQVIKNTQTQGKGTIQFGTEVISSADGSIACLLGASPGASTAVSIMLEILERCFASHLPQWEPKLKEMIPSYGLSLAEHPEKMKEIQAMTREVLGLEEKALVLS